MNCPYCGSSNVQCDEVDNGVGMQQCGPYGCEDCHAVQIGPDDDPSLASETERQFGFYYPFEDESEDGERPPTEGPSREDAALDALIVLAFSGGDSYPEPITVDDPSILSDEDKAAMESLGTSEELIARCQRIADERAAQNRGAAS